MEQLTERIARDKITIEYTLDNAPDYIDYKWASNSNWYRVTLTMGRRKLTTYFGMGVGLEREPEVYDVLSCLIMDASSTENIEGYYEWCHDLGMDPDDSTHRKSYTATLDNTRKLRRFLGDKYHAYLYETEDDG